VAQTVEVEVPVREQAGATELPEKQGFLGRIFGTLGANDDYRTFWYGNQIFMLVMQMQIVASGYLAYVLTNSATALGIVAVASGIPQLVISPLGGMLADRYPKRQLLIVAQGVVCLASATIGVLVLLNWIQYWHLIVASVVLGSSFAVIVPARQSWIPDMVKSQDLTSALALNNAGMNAARVVGPAVAGILIAVPWFGVQGVYLLQILAFIGVLVMLMQVSNPGMPELREAATVGANRVLAFSAELTSGLRYISNRATLTSLFIFAVVTMLLGQSYQNLIPAYALGVFNVGAEGQGIMQTAAGLGALFGSLTMAYLSQNPERVKIQAYSGTALGIALAIFGLCSAFQFFPGSLLALFVVGLALDFNATINQTLIMLNSDKALFGRVMAVYMMTFSLSGFSASLSGFMMDHIGGAATMLGQGIVLAIFVVYMATMNKGYRQIRNSLVDAAQAA
jgi:MFS family permease